MKKTLKSQLFAAVAILVIAAVALTGATYAWFTTTRNPEVKTIDLYVNTPDSLLLSANNDPLLTDVRNGVWTNSLSQEDIIGTSTRALLYASEIPDTNKNAFPSELNDVSNSFNKDHNTFYDQTQNDFGQSTGYVVAKAPGTDLMGSYVKFDLWIKSATDGMVYLDLNSYVRAVASIKATVALATEPGKYVQDAIRVGFVPYDYGVAASDGLSYDRPGVATQLCWDYAKVWEPHDTEHLPFAYGGQAGLPAAHVDTFCAIGTLATSIDSEAQVTNPLTTNMDLFQLTKGTKQRFAIYIWVEGADVDTLNAIAKNYFQTMLRFGQSTATSGFAY